MPTRKKSATATRKPSSRPPRILIVGLGNPLLQDDGVGVHAVHELQKLDLPGVLSVEVGTAVFDALYLLENADRVLAIDAMEAGGTPGTIYSLGVADVADQGPKASLHELGLLAALRFLVPGKAPRISVLGMEPESIAFGLELSPSLQATLPNLVRTAAQIVTCWKEESPAPDSRPRRDDSPPLGLRAGGVRRKENEK